MATFKLVKGGKFNLVKSVKSVLVGLGWDVASRPGEQFDLDASAFALIHTQQGTPRFYGNGSHAVCYANEDLVKNPDRSLQTADGTIVHTGDNRNGVGEGDDEAINIALDRLPPEIVEVSIFVTIYEAAKRKQDFSRVNSTFVRVVNDDTGEELCRYNMATEFAGQTTVQVGSFVRENGAWTFKAIGVGSNADLGDVINQYS